MRAITRGVLRGAVKFIPAFRGREYFDSDNELPVLVYLPAKREHVTDSLNQWGRLSPIERRISPCRSA